MTKFQELDAEDIIAVSGGMYGYGDDGYYPGYDPDDPFSCPPEYVLFITASGDVLCSEPGPFF